MNNFKIFEKKVELYVLKDSCEQRAYLIRCFPWSKPNQFISILSSKNIELHYLEDLNDLDAKSRLVIEKYLKQIDFSFSIEKIISINEDVELRHYNVLTKQGTRSFQTKLEDWPRYSGSVVSFSDLAGDIYLIEDLKLLDERSRKIISPYVS